MQFDSSQKDRLRVVSVIASITSGGIGPVCRYAAEGMAKQTEWQVTLLSLHDQKNDYIEHASGLRVISLGLDWNASQAFLDWLVNNPQDVLISSSVGPIEPAFPYLPCHMRHITQVHDSLLPYRQFVIRNAKWTDGVVCVANHITKKVSNGLVEEGCILPVQTIHNAAFYPKADSRVFNRKNIRCLFTGYPDALKGIFDITRLLKELHKLSIPVEIDIVGGYCQSLKDELDRNGLSQSVTWRGRVPHEECYQIAAMADIFLMLSRKEPFGMVTIEAMSMGCVPIAYNTPSGSTEIIQHNKNGILISLGDIKAMALEIAGLYHNRERLKQLSEKAMIRARQDFSQEKMTSQLVEFIRNVMARAQIQPAQRLPGRPPVAIEMPKWAGRTGYQRLPESWRAWLRMQFYRRHRLAYWWLNR